jgi:hypothetical protein
MAKFVDDNANEHIIMESTFFEIMFGSLKKSLNLNPRLRILDVYFIVNVLVEIEAI